MIDVALREPARHVGLIVEEGLEVLGLPSAVGTTAANPGGQPTTTTTAVVSLKRKKP